MLALDESAIACAIFAIAAISSKRWLRFASMTWSCRHPGWMVLARCTRNRASAAGLSTKPRFFREDHHDGQFGPFLSSILLFVSQWCLRRCMVYRCNASWSFNMGAAPHDALLVVVLVVVGVVLPWWKAATTNGGSASVGHARS